MSRLIVEAALVPPQISAEEAERRWNVIGLVKPGFRQLQQDQRFQPKYFHRVRFIELRIRLDEVIQRNVFRLKNTEDDFSLRMIGGSTRFLIKKNKNGTFSFRTLDGEPFQLSLDVQQGSEIHKFLSKNKGIRSHAYDNCSIPKADINSKKIVSIVKRYFQKSSILHCPKCLEEWLLLDERGKQVLDVYRSDFIKGKEKSCLSLCA